MKRGRDATEDRTPLSRCDVAPLAKRSPLRLVRHLPARFVVDSSVDIQAKRHSFQSGFEGGRRSEGTRSATVAVARVKKIRDAAGTFGSTVRRATLARVRRTGRRRSGRATGTYLGSTMTFSSGFPASSTPNTSDSARTRTCAARGTGTGTRRANQGVDGVILRMRFTREATHADILAARGTVVPLGREDERKNPRCEPV